MIDQFLQSEDRDPININKPLDIDFWPEQKYEKKIFWRDIKLYKSLVRGLDEQLVQVPIVYETTDKKIIDLIYMGIYYGNMMSAHIPYQYRYGAEISRELMLEALSAFDSAATNHRISAEKINSIIAASKDQIELVKINRDHWKKI